MRLKYLDFCGSKKHYPGVIEELCHEFSLEDLKKATNNFDEKLIIGNVCSGEMYKGCLEHNGVTDYTIALKRVDCKIYDFLEFLKEIELLCQLCHPNLVSLIGFCNHEKKKIIVYEYMPNGSLHDHLHRRDTDGMSWKKRLEICIGVARGLHYLHCGVKRIIFHLNINPHTILLDNKMMPKLSNFEISLQGPLSTSRPKAPKPFESHIHGRIGYKAPEFRYDGEVTDKCDVYSFGLVLLDVVWAVDERWKERAIEHSTATPYICCCPLHVLLFSEQFPIEEIIDPALNGKIAPECWQAFTDILQRCLKFEPDERPTTGAVEVLLEHALSLQEEADMRKTDGDYILSSTTYINGFRY